MSSEYEKWKQREGDSYYSKVEIVDRFEHSITEVIKQLYIIGQAIQRLPLSLKEIKE